VEDPRTASFELRDNGLDNLGRKEGDHSVEGAVSTRMRSIETDESTEKLTIDEQEFSRRLCSSLGDAGLTEVELRSIQDENVLKQVQS